MSLNFETDFENRLKNTIDETSIYKNEPMKKHTTFRVGGPTDYFIVPKTTEEVQEAVALCKEMSLPYYILGNGSNLLVSDAGYRGVVIQIYKEMGSIQVQGEQIRAQAGALLSKIGSIALAESLTGFEFAAGIPGCVGGAVVMNAGAYGGEMKDILETVTVLTPEGEVLTLKNEELELGYRTSIIAKRDYIVLEAVFKLQKGNQQDIKACMDDLRMKRTTKQPLEYPSAGSTFKRPEGYFAGKLIEDAGLRGFTVGGAQVSEKHCGFVINKGEATAQDIWNLMQQVSQIVWDKFGVKLEPEVKRLGDF